MSTPAACHRRSSAACVPLLSAREMNGAPTRTDLGECGGDVVALGLGRIRRRADDDEIVVHHRQPLGREAFGDELLLGGGVVHEHHVGVPAARHVERLTGADRNHADVDAGGLLELRQQVAEQAGLLGRRGRRHHDALVLRPGRRNRHRAQQQRPSSNDLHVHGNSPLRNNAASVGSTSLKKRSTGSSTTSRRPRGTPRVWPGAWPGRGCACSSRSSRRRAASASMSASTSRLALGSRLAVGSSRNRMSGCSAQARASARRCCCPPESARAGRSRQRRQADALQRTLRARLALGARHAAQPQREQQVASAPTGAAGTGAGTPSRCIGMRPLTRHAPRAGRRTAPGRAAGAAASSCRCRWRPPARARSPRRSVRLTSRSAARRRSARRRAPAAAEFGVARRRPIASASVRATIVAAIGMRSRRARATAARSRR